MKIKHLKFACAKSNAIHKINNTIEQELPKVDFNWAATHSHSFPVRNDFSHAEQESQ